MSYREMTMTDAKEILRRWQAGDGYREVARQTSIDRKTARRYVEAAELLGVTRETELVDEIVAAVARRVTARPAITKSEERRLLDPHRSTIEGWLTAHKPLKLTKAHDLLKRQGVEVTYSTLRRYVIAEFGWQQRATTVLLDDPPPGEEAQIDFGKVGRLYDEARGRERDLWALVITLANSRHMFVWPTFSQTTEAVVEGLEQAWRYFDGITLRIVPDNMSAIVDDANPEHPKIVEAFAEYAQARGFFVDPTRVSHPKDKARVENQIPYVRESCFEGESLGDLHAAREHARWWCTEKAGTRMHGTTRKRPIEVFAEMEKATLKTAPTDVYDVPKWSDTKVHPDHHITAARATYSLPTRFIGRKVRVRADRSTVRIYLAHELIKTHPRKGPGERSTDPSDYPAHKAPLAMRSVDSVVTAARKHGEHVGLLAERLFDVGVPWSRLRQGQKLVRYCEKYGDARVEDACRRALCFDVIDVPRIGRMIEAAVKSEDEAEEKGKLIRLPRPRFARDEKSFATISPEVTP